MKMIKPILVVVAVIVVAAIAYFIYTQILIERQRYLLSEPPYPLTLGSFDTVESTPINPTTLLDDIRSGKKLALHIQADTPDNPSFLMLVGWSQNDYLEIARAYQKVIWQDDPNLWHLYSTGFYTKCDNTRDKFGEADFKYYREVTKDGKSWYSVRDIEIAPEYGYLAWGGDTLFPRPRFGGWPDIMENITKVPAEKALALADERGGNDFRNKENNTCNISVSMGFERSDWSAIYSGKAHIQFWIPTK